MIASKTKLLAALAAVSIFGFGAHGPGSEIAGGSFGRLPTQQRGRDPIFRPTPVPRAATPAPSPVLTPAPIPPPLQPPPIVHLRLQLQFEADGPYVAQKELTEALRAVDPAASSQMDGLVGLMRVSIGGREFQALTQQPVLIVDGRYESVEKPLRMRGGAVLAPLETVKLLLAELAFITESDSGSYSTFRWSAEVARARGAAAPSVKLEASPVPPEFVVPTPPTPAPPPFALPGDDSLLSPVGARASPEIEGAPRAVGLDVGLTWEELADFAHRDPPSRLTLIYDPPLEDFALALEEIVRRAGPRVEINRARVERRRDDAELLAAVSATRPDFALDLVIQEGGRSTLQDAIEIWAVFDSLWVEGIGVGAAPDPDARLYLAHQFHNLALGAMLRRELNEAILDLDIHYELHPSYLLRRVDAPSAGVLLPGETLREDPDARDRIARALAGGLMAYRAGMASVGR